MDDATLIAETGGSANSDFIASAPSDVRALLAEVERLRGADVRCCEYEKEVRDLRAKIERLW